VLIDDLPVQAIPKKDAKVTLPVALWGRFRKGEVDRFTINVAAGQRVSFEAVGSRLGKTLIPHHRSRCQGRIVVQRDNDPGSTSISVSSTPSPRRAFTPSRSMTHAFHGSEHSLTSCAWANSPRRASPCRWRYARKRASWRLPELTGPAIGLDIPNGAQRPFLRCRQTARRRRLRLAAVGSDRR